MINKLIAVSFILALLGCGKPPSYNPKTPLDHHHLTPKGTYSYKVENIFSMHSQAVQTNQVNKTNALPTQTWSSRLNLDLKLTWQGYHQHQDFEWWPLATFGLEAKDIKLEESDSLPDWLWSWEEKIGSSPPVIMKINGLTVPKPMGEMLGDPRDYYLKGNNRLSFTPIGETARISKSGELVSKLQVLDHPAFIGQYFLGGLPLDEILHRSICRLPPKNTKSKTNWEVPHISHLNVPKTSETKEKWSAELLDRNGQKCWKITMSLKQNIPKGESKKGKAAFQYWILDRQLEAWVNPKDGMPEELTWQEAGSWMDALSYQDATNKMIHLPHQHRFKNRFHLSRP